MIKPEKTEKEFDVFFRQIGYSRVSDDISGSPNFKNADYVNKLDRIIVELKVLEKEHFEHGGVIDCLNATIHQPKAIDEGGYGQYTFSIPKVNRKGKHDSFEEPLRKTLKKANRQLRETKAFYGSDENALFTGYVMLAQTGLMSLSPEVTAAVVKKILSFEFSSIDGVIVCTPHGNLLNPLSATFNPICMSVTKNSKVHLQNQCMYIADAWCDFFGTQGHSGDFQ